MTMTVEEIGLLILKLQDDDVRIPEMRQFYRELCINEGMQRNAALVGRMCTLPEKTRKDYCTSGFLFCLASEDIASKAEPPNSIANRTKQTFVTKFYNQFRGPWRTHMREATTGAAITVSNGRRFREILLSPVLYTLLAAIEDLWNVRGHYLER